MNNNKIELHSRGENLPRGYRNNNPLNVIHSSSKWNGLSAEQPDKDFCSFTSRMFSGGLPSSFSNEPIVREAGIISRRSLSIGLQKRRMTRSVIFVGFPISWGIWM